MARKTVHILFLLACFAFCSQSDENPACFPAMFVFGDSYLDTGNRAALYPQAFQQVATGVVTVTNEPPYGQTFFHYANGRPSDGRLISDFLAEALGLGQFPGTYLQSVGSSFRTGVNFAMSGGTAVNNSFFLSRNISTVSPYSLLDQLGWFLRFKDLVLDNKEASAMLPHETDFCKGLYIVGEIGSNDYTVGLFNGGMSPEQLLSTVLPLVMETISDFFKKLYVSGARNFLFIGLPPAVDSPGYRSFGDPEAFIAFADFEGIHKQVMNHPEKYGFDDTTSACCGAPGRPFNFDRKVTCGQPGYVVCPDPSKFAYWDFSHFSDRYAQVAAQAFLSGEYLEPPNALKLKCGTDF